jgi:hemoglobin-like flavoprotein
MTSYQIGIIKSSWQAAAALGDAAGELFYGRLFEIAPEVKPMFSQITIKEQSKKLLSMLSYVINKLDRLQDILDEVAKLAQRHVHYGVKPEHYTVVGEALLWTLEKGLAEKWNDELKEAWTTCYVTLSGAMVHAAEYPRQNAA